jgi:7-dehydrocholesterol reductase
MKENTHCCHGDPNNLYGKVIWSIFSVTLLPFILLGLLMIICPTPLSQLSISLDMILLLLGFCLYAYLLTYLGLAFKPYQAHKNIDGFTPEYADNGFSYWVVSLIGFTVVCYIFPSLYVYIYTNFINLCFHLNILGYIVCFVLYQKGFQDLTQFYIDEHYSEEIQFKKVFGSDAFISYQTAQFIFRYYRGMKFHPKLFGIQVKQWINCRIGMMLWQILIIVFYMYSIHHRRDSNNTLMINVFLQTLYIGKFFYWEKGYFNTLDITLDRAGYYICWGCLFFVPTVYTSSTFTMATYPYNADNAVLMTLFIIGLAALCCNYYIDQQKFLFQQDKKKDDSSKHKVDIFEHNGKKFNIIYNDKWKWLEEKVNERHTHRLLLSNFWCIGRHINYTFEILLAFIWTGVAFLTSFDPVYYICFGYTLFLIILLVHRTGRDDRKCSYKYTDLWEAYKKIVPTNFLPYFI